MEIVRFTAGASAEALAGIADGDRVAELGAASVAALLAEPAVALPAAKGRCAGSWSSVTQAPPDAKGDRRSRDVWRSCCSYLPGGWDL